MVYFCHQFNLAVKRYKQIIQQYIVVSLLVIYQLIGWVHIAYLPRLNNASNLHSPASIDFLHKNSNSSLPRVQFQRSFHSVDESRKDLTPPTRILTLFFAFVLICGITSPVAKKPDSALASVYSHSPSSYLNLRTLRIWVLFIFKLLIRGLQHPY